MMIYNLASCLTAILLILASGVIGQSSINETSSAIESSNTYLPSSVISTTFFTEEPTETATPTIATESSDSDIIFNPQPTVQGTGWDPNGNSVEEKHESWLKSHNRFVFVIFLGLIVIGLLLWYIIRSVKGMRKKLKTENQEHLNMMQSAASPRANSRECATPISSPPAYKYDDHLENTTRP